MKKLYFTLTGLILVSFGLQAQTFWTGPTINITKLDFADWLLPENQDSITPNVRLTRKSSQGLFNIAQESGFQGIPGNSDGSPSPVGTEWAFGSISDGVGNLTFAPLVETMQGDIRDNILNGPLVLHLTAEDIYIDVTFLDWSHSSASGGGGGFSYNRTTQSYEGTNNLDGKLNLQIHPNPVAEFLRVVGTEPGTEYAVYDIVGDMHLNGTLKSDRQISVVQLPAGVYLIRFKNGAVRRFIKH